MPLTPSLNPRIIEALYAETLVLADEVRGQFEAARRAASADTSGADDLSRIALSCEALRTTTRVMHSLAWLLNHRAHFAGELSELQLRRHGRLVANVPPSDPENYAMLPPAMQVLIDESERVYARVLRLEKAWRGEPAGTSAIDRLRDRLNRALDAG